jgi:hypothetical protein
VATILQCLPSKIAGSWRSPTDSQCTSTIMDLVKHVPERDAGTCTGLTSRVNEMKVVSEYSRAEFFPWAMDLVTREIDLVDARSYSTRVLCTEMITKAEDGMVTYTASQLGIRCAARANGFHVLLDADATIAEVIDGDPPRYCIVISNKLYIRVSRAAHSQYGE